MSGDDPNDTTPPLPLSTRLGGCFKFPLAVNAFCEATECKTQRLDETATLAETNDSKEG